MGVEINEENFGDELNSKVGLGVKFDKLRTWERKGSCWSMTCG